MIHAISRLASYPPRGKEKEAVMPQKCIVTCLVILCITLLIFTWMTRSSLCELRVKQENIEFAATLACASPS